MFWPVFITVILLFLLVLYATWDGESWDAYERRKWKETLKELHDEIKLENGSTPQHFYEWATTAYREVKKKTEVCEEEVLDDFDD